MDITRAMKISTHSWQIADDSYIPSRFTCDGDEISPELRIEDIPLNAKSLALVMDDPDASGGSTFVHWILFNIPVTSSSAMIPEGVSVLGFCGQGTTSAGRTGYVGPCPGDGKAHRYFFRLYALDAIFTHAQDGLSAEALRNLLSGHIIEQAEFFTRYARISQ